MQRALCVMCCLAVSKDVFGFQVGIACSCLLAVGVSWLMFLVCCMCICSVCYLLVFVVVVCVKGVACW